LFIRRPRGAPLQRPIRTAAVTRRGRLPLFLAVVQAILGYEWLISGLNKLLAPRFDAHLAALLQHSTPGNPYRWYTAFLQRVVLPHHTLVAPLDQWGETAIGVVLLLSAVLWLVRPRDRLTVRVAGVAALALLGAALLNVNYFLQGVAPLPWINPGNAYNPGVDIDALLPLIALALVAANVRVVRRRGRRVYDAPDHGVDRTQGAARRARLARAWHELSTSDLTIIGDTGWAVPTLCD